MPKIDLASAPTFHGSSYPPPFDEPCRSRSGVQLGAAVGLTQFGVNLMKLAPGAWASQRHWHQHEDELVYVLEGELVLVEDAGETVLRPGDSAGWPAGVPDGHHLQNRSPAAFGNILESRRRICDGVDSTDRLASGWWAARAT